MLPTMLNLGCGTTHFPSEPPRSHAGLLPDTLYQYPNWLNVDRNALPGVDCVMDLFAYPWSLESDAYDGAVLAHILEHVEHEIRVCEPDPNSYDDSDAGMLAYMRAFKQSQAVKRELKLKYQNGFMAFMGELYRVLKPGAQVYIISPYAWSQGAATDYTHTRLVTEQLFTHNGMTPQADSFQYASTCNFKLNGYRFRPTELFAHLFNDQAEWARALQTHINVVYEIAVILEVVK